MQGTQTHGGSQNVQLKNKKVMKQGNHQFKNQSIQLNTDGADSLTAQEAATYYSSALNAQHIINSRRQAKRFGAGSVVGNSNNGTLTGNMGASSNGSGVMGIGQKMPAKFKSNNSPAGFTKTFY